MHQHVIAVRHCESQELQRLFFPSGCISLFEARAWKAVIFQRQEQLTFRSCKSLCSPVKASLEHTISAQLYKTLSQQGRYRSVQFAWLYLIPMPLTGRDKYTSAPVCCSVYQLADISSAPEHPTTTKDVELRHTQMLVAGSILRA